MCVCTCTCVCVCVLVCVCAHVCIRVCVLHACVCMYIRGIGLTGVCPFGPSDL